MSRSASTTMDRGELRNLLGGCLREFQEISGDEVPAALKGEVDEKTKLGEIQNLDSIRAAEIHVALSGLLNLDIEELRGLFDPKNYAGVPSLEELTIGHVLDTLTSMVSKHVQNDD